MASGEEKGSRLRQGHRTSLNTDTSYVSSTNSPTPQLVTIGSGQSVTFRPTLNEAKTVKKPTTFSRSASESAGGVRPKEFASPNGERFCKTTEQLPTSTTVEVYDKQTERRPRDQHISIDRTTHTKEELFKQISVSTVKKPTTLSRSASEIAGGVRPKKFAFQNGERNFKTTVQHPASTNAEVYDKLEERTRDKHLTDHKELFKEEKRNIESSILVKKQMQILREQVFRRLRNNTDIGQGLTDFDFKENGGHLDCTLRGTEKAVTNAIGIIRNLENDVRSVEVCFTAKVMSELHKLNVENSLNETLKLEFPECVVKQEKLEFPECVVRQEKSKVHVYGFDVTKLREAKRFISGMIIEYTLPDDVKTQFCEKYEKELLVFQDKEGRTQLIGLKEAVANAMEELFILNREGRLTDTRRQLVDIKCFPLDREMQLHCLEKCVDFEAVKKKYHVNIIFHQKLMIIEITGLSVDIQKAYEEIKGILELMYCEKMDQVSQQASTFFCKELGKIFLRDLEQTKKVYIEKEVLYYVRRKKVTKKHSLEEIVWLDDKERELILQISNLNDVKASAFAIPKLDESKGLRFSRHGNTIEVPVSPWIDGNYQETEAVATKLLSKAKDGHETTLAISMASFCNWPFDEYMKCFVKSSVSWLLGQSHVWPSCVILFTESMDHFKKMDEYIEQCVTDWQKDLKDKIDYPVIRVLKQQLDQTEADVLVNTTGPNLDLRVGNVSAALSKAVGPDLQEECSSKFQNGITPGTVAITKGFNLMCKQLFHITLPYYVDVKQCIESIRNAVVQCLETATTNGHETIAFPIIGSGNLAYPIELVCSEMFGSVERYRQSRPDKPLAEVRFVVYHKDTTLYEKFKKEEDKQKTLLRESLSSKHHKTTCEIKLKITGREEDVLNAKAILESKDKEISTKDTLDMQELPPEQMRKHQIGDEAAYTQEKVRYQGASRPKQRKSVFKRNFSWSKDVKNLEIYENGNLVIKVYEADILKVPTEGIVNAANEDLRHIGGIAGAIAKHAGKKLEEESRNIVKEEGKLKVSSVVCTSGGNLNFTHVLHAVGPRWRDYQPFTEANVQKCADDLKLTYLQCLRMAESKQIKTLAIPTISSGIFKVPKDMCAVQYAEAILEFGDRTDSLKELHVVDKDSDMIDIVQKIFYAMLTERKAAPNCLSKFVDTQVEQTKMGIHDKETNTMKNMKNTGRDKSKVHINNESAVEQTTEDCVICMDKVTDEKILNCGHIFCSECIDGYFRIKMVCPTCGKVCGKVTGDQPSGKMRIEKIHRYVTGFEGCKSISIMYQFENGKQGPDHPRPGDFYKGISRTAYLPDNKEGREICAMLKVAFERRLVFTIGTSRTTGKEGVITWNDIHHKTDLRPFTQFGYPDATYLQRVREELTVKGVTIDDVDDDFIEQIKNNDFTKTIRL